MYAPFDPQAMFGMTGEILVNLAIGFAFGFVLERAGFGDSRRLVAQFYLTEMRVLKVMFTAIVVAMLLILWAGVLGLANLAELAINPTYLASATLGGFILGTGFVIGGYCPGTALVAMATLKLDGLFFVGGVILGLLGFDLAAPAVWSFYQGTGYYGFATLPGVLHLSPGIVAVAVVAMAIGAFAAAEWVERRFGAGAAKEMRG